MEVRSISPSDDQWSDSQLILSLTSGDWHGACLMNFFSFSRWQLLLQTLSAITSCILALIENPTVLQKAQEELDRVIRPGHLPDFEDKDSLPYVTAITMEILRWRDVIPLGEFFDAFWVGFDRSAPWRVRTPPLSYGWWRIQRLSHSSWHNCSGQFMVSCFTFIDMAPRRSSNLSGPCSITRTFISILSLSIPIGL